MIDFFYKSTYELPCAMSQAEQLQFHANMHALGDKFGAEELEVVAGKSFNDVLEKASIEEAIMTVPTVYEITPASVRRLRDMLVWKVGSRFEDVLNSSGLSRDPKISEAMEKSANFSVDVAFLTGHRLQKLMDIAYVYWDCPHCLMQKFVHLRPSLIDGVDCRCGNRTNDFYEGLPDGSTVVDGWPGEGEEEW